MKLTGNYRHELKYQVSEADYQAMRRRLGAVMKPDPHAGADGQYTVHSVYFDNYRDKALREKRDGVQRREKFRIRYYNEDLSHITLEKKIKHNNLCLKVGAAITQAEYEHILTQSGPWMLSHSSELVRELYCKMKTQQLRPRVLVSYVREPYLYRPGNVRVTFDSQIRSSLFRRSFSVGEGQDIVVPQESGRILEVKFDEFLPDVIACLLQTGGLRQQAFSKYGASRQFG